MAKTLTIGQLAERTGLQPATLRMWEQRHGFPRAERLPSGHRRYPVEEVDQVIEVRRARDGGLSLTAAIDRLVNGVAKSTPSIYAGLRRLRPDLHPYPVPKRLLVPISHAIEDECSVRGERAVFIGSFQRERFYRQAEKRWQGFARTAEIAVALADFDEPREPEEVRSRSRSNAATRWPTSGPSSATDPTSAPAWPAGSAPGRVSGCSR